MSIYYVIRDGEGGVGLPDLLQYYIGGGGLPNLLVTPFREQYTVSP